MPRWLQKDEIIEHLQASSLEVAQDANKSLAKVINKERVFCFKPYSYTLRGVITVQLLGDTTKKST